MGKVVANTFTFFAAHLLLDNRCKCGHLKTAHGPEELAKIVKPKVKEQLPVEELIQEEEQKGRNSVDEDA